MRLFQLGAEYLQRADELLSRIHVLSKNIKTLNGNEQIVMKRRILSLYIDAAECRRQAKHLMNYQKGDIENEQNNF